MSGEARVAAPVAAPDKSPDRIAGMFDAIAPRYDLLNRLLSAGIDRWWRKRAIDSLQLTGREVLVDVATGTADVALEACAPRRGSARAARVVGVDFARAMLALGVGKVAAAGESQHIVLVHGDAMRLPVASGSADAVTIAFGIRNVQAASVACAEMARVLKPGGRLAILEFGVPRVPGVSGLYQWYFRAVLPRVGRMISGHTGAYSYLPASVGTFTPPAEFARMLESAGFGSVRADPLTIGIVYLYTARRI
jgi:demethylmenaquinone methyltransferase/2-methoxy-6-polyprenyl-1,4-benzoquinol methylase